MRRNHPKAGDRHWDQPHVHISGATFMNQRPRASELVWRKTAPHRRVLPIVTFFDSSRWVSRAVRSSLTCRFDTARALRERARGRVYASSKVARDRPRSDLNRAASKRHIPSRKISHCRARDARTATSTSSAGPVSPANFRRAPVGNPARSIFGLSRWNDGRNLGLKGRVGRHDRPPVAWIPEGPSFREHGSR